MDDGFDARIPVVFGTRRDLRSGDAALLEGDTVAPDAAVIVRFAAKEGGHFRGCACCRSRTGAAQALTALFLHRARSAQGWFRRVVVLAGTGQGRDEVERALEEDILVAARFRLGAPLAQGPDNPPAPMGAA